MDFSRVQLSDDDQAFLVEARDFLRTHVTEDVIRRDRETGDNFDEGVHLALGAAGYLAQDWKPDPRAASTASDADLEWRNDGRTCRGYFRHDRHDRAVGGEVRLPRTEAEVMPRVFSGRVRLCLGYTEPEGGSDVATCKTRAVRDGDGWIINGSKMFTTGAHNCQYVFLITNTDPDAPKPRA